MNSVKYNYKSYSLKTLNNPIFFTIVYHNSLRSIPRTPKPTIAPFPKNHLPKSFALLIFQLLPILKGPYYLLESNKKSF